jgi:hypothetical protein
MGGIFLKGMHPVLDSGIVQPLQNESENISSVLLIFLVVLIAVLTCLILTSVKDYLTGPKEENERKV